MSKVKAAFCNNNSLSDGITSKIWGDGRWERLIELTNMYPVRINKENFTEHIDSIREIEVMFSCWGMPQFTKEQIEEFTSLKAIFYASGSVKQFAAEYLKREIKVMSSWQANAIPVAEFTLAQILLSAKGYWLNSLQCKESRKNSGAFRGGGIYNQSVALLGCGSIARYLIRLLKPFNFDIYVVDPYLAKVEAAKLGVEIISIEQAFQKANIISNHLPNLPNLKNIINENLLDSMSENAVFINTGRGAQLDHYALIKVFKEREDLTALLDVTDPEPLAADSALFDMPNIRISSHIAGSIGNEVVRMADYAIEDFIRWNSGQKMFYEIKFEDLDKMA